MGCFNWDLYFSAPPTLTPSSGLYFPHCQCPGSPRRGEDSLTCDYFGRRWRGVCRYPISRQLRGRVRRRRDAGSVPGLGHGPGPGQGATLRWAGSRAGLGGHGQVLPQRGRPGRARSLRQRGGAGLLWSVLTWSCLEAALGLQGRCHLRRGLRGGVAGSLDWGQAAGISPRR